MAAGHGFGPEQPGVGDVGRSIHRQRRQCARRQRRQSCAKCLAQLSGVGRILADGSGNIVGIITEPADVRRPHCGTAAPRSCSSRTGLATRAAWSTDSSSNLDAALKDLSVAVGDVQRFIARNP